MPWAASLSQRETRRDEGARQRQAKREGALVADDFQAPKLVAEAAFELFLEDQVVGGNQPVGIRRPLRPDERGAVVLERQDGEG